MGRCRGCGVKNGLKAVRGDGCSYKSLRASRLSSRMVGSGVTVGSGSAKEVSAASLANASMWALNAWILGDNAED